MDELTAVEIARADQLLAAFGEPIDLGFPTLSFDDAVLCCRRVTGLDEAAAAQLVSANRGDLFDDVMIVDSEN
jgi:hypothetical protein